VADVALDMAVDVHTAEKIRKILVKKAAAVAREDYDEAKRLKAGVDRLKLVGMKVAQLEAQKQAAVDAEDYDTAKMLKVKTHTSVTPYGACGVTLVSQWGGGHCNPPPTSLGSRGGGGQGCSSR
jgi:hypothetical protein